MRPPECRICHDDMMDDEKGGLVYFKKRPSDIEWAEKMERTGMVGHPPYCDWFCKNHIKQARELKHLPINEAMEIMRK